MCVISYQLDNILFYPDVWWKTVQVECQNKLSKAQWRFWSLCGQDYDFLIQKSLSYYPLFSGHNCSVRSVFLLYLFFVILFFYYVIIITNIFVCRGLLSSDYCNQPVRKSKALSFSHENWYISPIQITLKRGLKECRSRCVQKFSLAKLVHSGLSGKVEFSRKISTPPPPTDFPFSTSVYHFHWKENAYDHLCCPITSAQVMQ